MVRWDFDWLWTPSALNQQRVVAATGPLAERARERPGDAALAAGGLAALSAGLLGRRLRGRLLRPCGALAPRRMGRMERVQRVEWGKISN